jgi:hypothetical protein
MAGSIKYEDPGPDQPVQKTRPYLKNNQSKMAGGTAQAVGRLPSNYEALGSNSQHQKNK